MKNKEGIQFWAVFLLTTILSGLFVYLNFSEFIIVGILNKTGSYPFGGEGDTAWYYKSKELYAAVSFISGLLFLVPFLFSFRCIIKNKEQQQLVFFFITVFLITAQIINGQTG